MFVLGFDSGSTLKSSLISELFSVLGITKLKLNSVNSACLLIILAN